MEVQVIKKINRNEIKGKRYSSKLKVAAYAI